VFFIDAMKGGSVRFVAIESKSFDLRVVGSTVTILKISEHGWEGDSRFFALTSCSVAVESLGEV